MLATDAHRNGVMDGHRRTRNGVFDFAMRLIGIHLVVCASVHAACAVKYLTAFRLLFVSHVGDSLAKLACMPPKNGEIAL